MKLTLQLIAIVMIASGCASKSNEKLNEKMSQEPTVNTTSELRTEARNSISDASNLTVVQKNKLTELRRSLTTQIDEMNRQSLELRSILLKDLLSSNYDAKEVSLIKSRMRKLEDQRLSVIFDSVDKANAILGRPSADNRQIMGEFIGERESQY